MKRQLGTLTPNLFVRAFTTLVRPILEYNMCALPPVLERDKDAVENVQRRASKRVKGLWDFPYEERLRILGLFSLRYRRTRGDLIMVHRMLTSEDHPNKCLLTPKNLNTNRGHNKMLKHERTTTSIRQQFFSVRICRLWNSLPEHIVNATSETQFKRLLDKHMEADGTVWNGKTDPIPRGYK